MTNFIPLFPLNIVVYPNEDLNLHIFEERYKQLIKECFEEKKKFGIPTVLKTGIAEMGTTVEILSIEKVHENGELDIKTKGREVFKILEVIHEIPNKLFMGAIVNYPENNQKGIQTKMNSILEEMRYFHELLEVSKKYKIQDENILSYDIAHHVGMSLEQEYEFLNLLREDQRQEYIHRHLSQIIPSIKELQNLKHRIQLNGHFRKLSIDDTDTKNSD